MSKITEEEITRRTENVIETLLKDGLVTRVGDIVYPTELGQSKSLNLLRAVFMQLNGYLYPKGTEKTLDRDLAKFTIAVMKQMTCVQVLVEFYAIEAGYIGKE